MGGKTRDGWIDSTVAAKGMALMGVTLGVPDRVINDGDFSRKSQKSDTSCFLINK